MGAAPFGYPCQRQRCFPLDTLCQQGCTSPLLETQSQKVGNALLWNPLVFSTAVGTQTVKMQFGTLTPKIQKRYRFHPVI